MMTDRLPLEGIRVLDLSRIIAGPNCTMQLGDMGAEVIKIEAPGDGDDSRRMKPPEVGGEGHFYLAFNRNKKSVVIDMKAPAGRDLIHRLAAESDVMVENFRPGVTARLGIDYEAIKAINPKLIYCSVSAYGQKGMMSERPGLDPVFQAEMGLMSVAGAIDGEPMRHPLSIIDLFTSLYASTAICAAVVDQQATGTGRHIDVSLMGGAISVLSNSAQYYFASGETPPRMGNGFPTVTPVGAFEGSDGGMFYLACGTQRLYENLVVNALGRPDLRDDPRFVTMSDRVNHRDIFMPLLADIFQTNTRDHWVATLRDASVPCGPVRNIQEALESPEVIEAGLVQTLKHPTAGDLRTLRSPIGLPGGPEREDTPPPLLGEHTDRVLHDVLKLDDATLASLRADKVIA
jgi:crotonobetainyl-CoA:carnitine CoA-transferase CaiB-like acyl-CoA transferase